MFEDDPLWYKDAIVYQLHVKCFHDSNDDGIGDFAGLAQRLEYIRDLGATAIWLLPFYPSPLRDDGYDIADYYDLHPDYGTLRDFRAFVRKAHRLGLKVITELVINHTSDEHPWFQAARHAPAGSAKRDFYVWSETDKRFPETRIIFTDTETSNWAWDPVAKAYYFHRFFSHQPDLNHNNPKVVKAVSRVMKHWLDMGVDGLRLDAIPYLCVREGTNNENLPETHQVIKRLRAGLDASFRNRMLLAEANQWPEDVRHYFGQEDECHMAFHFPLMPRIYMAVAQEDRGPIVEIMGQTPEIPDSCQWAIFLRNHDELTLEMVTDHERDYMYQTYASDPKMRRNVGICRRLAPLMDNDRNRIELLNSLLLSFPGTPIIYYGDEIGMGDNIYLGDRDGVRTPMQWSIDRNAGFSRADPAQLYLPVIMNPVYGYQAVNVEAQSRSQSSPLSWIKHIIAERKAHQAFGRGSIRFLEPHNQKILAYLREHEGSTLLCVANLAGTPQPVELDLDQFNGLIPVELIGRTPFPRIGELPYLLTLPGHGFYWFKLSGDEGIQSFEALRAAPRVKWPFWVLPRGWQTVIEGWQQLARELLPPFLTAQRWFGGKNTPIERIELEVGLVENDQGSSWLLCVVHVHLEGWEEQIYFLPLGISWEDQGDRLLQHSPKAVLAKVRQGSHPGVLHDAFHDPDFARWMLSAIRDGTTIAFGDGELRCGTTSAFPATVSTHPSEIRNLGVEQSHTSMVLDDTVVLKGYRRMPVSPSSELEVGRFLTEVARFPNTPPVTGFMEYDRAGEGNLNIALLQGYVHNQGDGWSFTLNHVEQLLERHLTATIARSADLARSARTPSGERPERQGEGEEGYLSWAYTLGLRTGQLHSALAMGTGDPAFDPEPITAEDLSRWRDTVITDAHRTLEALAGQLAAPTRPTGLQLPQASELRVEVEQLLGRTDVLERRIRELTPKGSVGVKTRFHGDYHLGQVLVAGHDIQIIDFEGERPRPGSPPLTRHSPLRDVAGMLRSFDYAAHAALFGVAVGRPDDRAVLTPVALGWYREATGAFLSGYQEGCASWPADDAAASSLIELFVLEKALYEINYEMNHRPDWLVIPIRGIIALLDGSPEARAKEGSRRTDRL